MTCHYKVTAIFIVLCCLYSPAWALDPWTKTDTAFQITTTILQAVDWKQARSGAKDRWSGTEYRKWEETGEAKYFIGSSPSVNQTNWFFAGSIIGHAAIARLLPNPYRRIWQCVFIASEVHSVAHNYKVGIRFNW